MAYRSLAAEFEGGMRSWGDTAIALRTDGRISPEVTQEILWLEQFGRLIANDDMHYGNLAFFVDGERLLGLTPVFDMTAMFYAPLRGNLPEGRYQPPTPSPAHSQVWRAAFAAALDLWQTAARHEEISPDFREIARESVESLEAWRDVAERLPS